MIIFGEGPWFRLPCRSELIRAQGARISRGIDQQEPIRTMNSHSVLDCARDTTRVNSFLVELGRVSNRPRLLLGAERLAGLSSTYKSLEKDRGFWGFSRFRLQLIY